MDSPNRQNRSNATILMLGWELPPLISGGLGVACDGFLRGLSEVSGLDIDFVLPSSPANLNAYPASVRIIELQKTCVSLQGHAPRLQGSYTTYRNNAKEYALDTLRAVNKIQDFDLIHAHDWVTFEAAQTIKQVTGKPLVVHIHSTEYDRAGYRAAIPAIVELERAGMQAADRIVAVSNYTKACLIREYAQSAEKIDVVYNGHRRFDMRNQAPKSEGCVCFIGRITEQKGPEAFVQAASLIHERMPEVRFVMAGDGNLLPQMRSLVRALGVSDVFTFPGFIDREEVEHLLMRSRVLVMPSLSEPFGLVGLEAIKAGVPVVLPRNCGLTELVPSATCIDPEDIESIANATLRLLDNPALAQKSADAAMQEVLSLDWDRSTTALLDVYEAALGYQIAARSNAMAV